MDFLRIFDILPYQKERFPSKTAISVKRNKTWSSYSIEQCMQQVNCVSVGLLRLGIQKGDRVGILSRHGSPEWIFFDLGAQQIGSVVVPIHASLTKQELQYIAEESEIKICVVANQEQFEVIHSLQAALPHLKHLYAIEALPGVPSWEDLIGGDPTQEELQQVEGLKKEVKEQQLATIIYTSGTSGNPKGVMLSHHNIVSNIKSVIPLIPVDARKRVFSFLPPSHIFERMVTYTYLATGASIYYPENLDNLLSDIKQVRPHYFTAVPKVLERAYDALIHHTAQRTVIARRLIQWAISLGKHYKEHRRIQMPDYWFQHRLAHILVFYWWRRQLGGRLKGIIVGAAALPPQLGKLLAAAGIPVREGYGLTETSPVVAFNRFEPGGVRFGTVGIPVPGVEVKISQPNEQGEGEILVRGPNVMMGYYKKEAETKSVLDKDGWLHTGDIGQIVFKHFLRITDRQKDIFKTTSGLYVAPQYVERQFTASPLVEQCMVMGFNRPYAVALILPYFPALKRWCEENKVHWTAPQYMVLNPKVLKRMEQEVERINESLSHHQRIKKFHLLYQKWTTESGELTPTLKAKRKFISDKYQKEIELLYK